MDERFDFLLDAIQNEVNLGRTIESARHSLRRAFDPEMVDKAIVEFQHRLRQSQNSESAVIRDSRKGREDWYAGPLTSSDSHWNLLREHLKNEKTWSDGMVDSLDDASTAVLANLASPFGPDERRVKGLVLGYVQSGKTANFSAVIAKAVDSGYRMIIVLAGLHNNLRLQTEKRLFHEICAPNLSACTNLTAVDHNGDFKRTQTQKAERACGRSDGFALAVLKKNSRVLRSFESWLSEAKPEILKGCPALIIDDESDHASVNYNNPEESPTAINQLIRNIIGRFGTLSYVGYTATPFANILIDASIEDDLYPRDFLISLEKPPTYFGAAELFGSEAFDDSGEKRPGLPIIRTIGGVEAASLTAIRRKKSVTTTSPDELPVDLRQALLSFILAGAIRLTRGQWDNHITMLVHTSRLTDYQAVLYERISRFCEQLKVEAETDPHLSVLDDLQTLFISDYLPVSKQFPAAKEWDFQTVVKNVSKFIKRLEVILDNSNSDERLSFDRPEPLCGIVIGGDTLSRGLTIEGLTTSYYVREAKGYDTLMQMGRWFGFRPGYVDLTRIYMPESLQRKFFHLSIVEEEMRNEIRVMAENKERPIDVALRVRSHPSMAITSNLKMRMAESSALTYSGTKVQARYVVPANAKLLERNFKSVLDLVSQVAKLGIEATRSSFEDFSACALFRKVPVEVILQFLDAHSFSDANIRFSSQLLKNYITDLAGQGELTSWSIGLMSSKSGETLDVGRGIHLHKLHRSIISESTSERDPHAVYLAGLSPPDDELIDLDDMANASMKFVSEFRKTPEGLKRNCSAIRIAQRPPVRGLLLLYPLVTNSAEAGPAEPGEMSEPFMATGRLAPLKAITDMFGVTFVFPKTDKATGPHHYVVNGSV